MRLSCSKQNVLRVKSNLTHVFCLYNSICSWALWFKRRTMPWDCYSSEIIASGPLVRSENILQLRETRVWYYVLRCQFLVHTIIHFTYTSLPEFDYYLWFILWNHSVSSLKSVISTAVRSDLRWIWCMAVWDSAESRHRPKGNDLFTFATCKRINKVITQLRLASKCMETHFFF